MMEEETRGMKRGSCGSVYPHGDNVNARCKKECNNDNKNVNEESMLVSLLSVVDEKDKDVVKQAAASTTTINVEHLFNAAKTKLEQAKVQLEEAHHYMDQVRQQIRSHGYAEPDSLLYLSYANNNKNNKDDDDDDDDDTYCYNDHLLTNIFDFIDMKDAAMCSVVCKQLYRNIQTNYWSTIETKMNLSPNNSMISPPSSLKTMSVTRQEDEDEEEDEEEDEDDPIISSLISPSATTSMERVLRYHTSSKEAERIASGGELLSKYLIITDIDDESDQFVYSRVGDHHCCSGDCDLFPEELNFDMFGGGPNDTNCCADGDAYELFVRFSRTDDNYLFAEGFLSNQQPDYDDNTSTIWSDLDHINFSAWQKLIDINLLLAEGKMDNDPPDEVVEQAKEQIQACMREVTVTVVAVHKKTSKASLVLAQSNFSDTDIQEGEGHCWTRNKLSIKSNGPIRSKSVDNDNVLADSHGRIGILYETEHFDDEDPEQPRITSWSLDLEVTIETNS